MARDIFNVLLVGAGEINFGSVEGPWNHTLRLERKLSSRLRVVAIIDPDIARATAAIELKRAGESRAGYVDCEIFSSVEAASKNLSADQKPRLIVVGAPPFARGTDFPGRDLELRLLEAFPRCPLFVEKPVSSGPEDACWRVATAIRERKTLVGVGYMLRYSKAVQKMKEIIRENNLIVMGTNARFVMAYEYAQKLAWWDKTRSGGPIIEQATHFCDLSRYFGGDVSLPTVFAHVLSHNDPPGILTAQKFDENLILPSDRIPRLTSASWKYEGGAVGSLMHVVALHGTTYDTELEVYADGYRLKLVDPYNAPVLSVRRPGNPNEEIYTFKGDDPFFNEISTFIDVVEGSAHTHDILSSYEDAVKTYEFTWQIRRASEAAHGAP